MSKSKQPSNPVEENQVRVFRSNYDLYPDKNNMPDTSFYQELYKYKSVQEYLDHKKKLERKKKRQRRKKMLQSLASVDLDTNSLDFSFDKYQYFTPFSQTGEYPVTDANLIGGLYDHVTLRPDFDDKSIGSNINYGVEKDYPNKPYVRNQDVYIKSDDGLLDILNDLLQNTQDLPYAAESPIYGMPDGINPVSDKDQIYDQRGYDSEYGYDVTDSGNTSYLGVPFPEI